MLDLIHARRDSNRVYYRANREGPLFPEIHNLVLKTAGLADVLRSVLKDEGIRTAFVFGSVAQGSERDGSDLDLMVIGDIGLLTLSKLLSGVSEKIGREINPHVFSVGEFRERTGNRDHFIVNVLHSEKVFVIGNENDLKAMAG
jgi:predicted nucleotidyltransferase